MSIDALYRATAGLRLTQAQIGVVAQNVANAGTVGYVRRTLDAVTTGPGNGGVASGTIGRALDAAALRQLRLETSGAAYTALNANVLGTLDKLYGVPGDSSALDALMNGFTASLQTLTANPTSTAARAAVVGAGGDLAAKIGTIAQGVQDLRSAVEGQLGEDTSQANGLLASIAKLNTQISASGSDADRAELQDRRDQAVNSLSALMDVQTVTQGDGTVTVLTNSGITLVDHGTAAGLSFDGRGALTPEAVYSTDPAQRGVGTITARLPGGATIDLAAQGTIRSGSIAAALELRDSVLPQAQRQLDELAAGLARAATDRLDTGTAVTVGAQSGFDLDLTGLSAGNALTLTVKDSSGTQRNLILTPSYLAPPAAPGAAETDDSGAVIIPITIPKPPTDATTAAATRTAISGALSSYGLTVSAVSGGAVGAVRILSGGGTSLLAASASVTQTASATATKTGVSQFALFVDGGRGNALYTGSFDGGSQLTGFAQRIVVNPAVSSNTASLVAMSDTTPTSDPTRPQALYDALVSARRTFSSSTGIGGLNAPFSASVGDFARSVIAAQGAAAASASDLDEGQGIALATAQGRFAEQSGVNIDEEMSKLIELQTAYSANARVLTAARDMLDTLLRT